MSIKPIKDAVRQGSKLSHQSILSLLIEAATSHVPMVVAPLFAQQVLDWSRFSHLAGLWSRGIKIASGVPPGFEWNSGGRILSQGLCYRGHSHVPHRDATTGNAEHTPSASVIC